MGLNAYLDGSDLDIHNSQKTNSKTKQTIHIKEKI